MEPTPAVRAEDPSEREPRAEVQVSIDRLRVTRGNGLSVEAKNVILTATGPDAADAAESVRVLLAEVIDRLAEQQSSS